jgi:hypothetical protein
MINMYVCPRCGGSGTLLYKGGACFGEGEYDNCYQCQGSGKSETPYVVERKDEKITGLESFLIFVSLFVPTVAFIVCLYFV